VWAFPADEHSGAGRVAGQRPGREQTGQLGDVGAGAGLAVGVDGVGPGRGRQRVDGGAFSVGDRPAHAELCQYGLGAQAADVGQERLGAARPVRADEHRNAVPVRIRHLRQRLVQDADVVSGGVRAGVTRPQQPGQELPGVVAERQDRVVAK